MCVIYVSEPALTRLLPIFCPCLPHLFPHLSFVLIVLFLLSIARYLPTGDAIKYNSDIDIIHLIFMTHSLSLQIRKELHDHDCDGLLQVDGVVLINYHWLPSNPQLSLLLLNLLLHPSCKKYSR